MRISDWSSDVCSSDLIDQGGCFETARGTTHADPTYVEEGCVHYCVTNMPCAVARTATFALNNATLPFILALADKGHRRPVAAAPHPKNGLNAACGKVPYKAVAEAHDLAFVPAEPRMEQTGEAPWREKECKD